MGTVLHVITKNRAAGPGEFDAWWERDRTQREIERLQCERDRMQREVEQLQREKDRLMRFAVAGAQIPVLIHELRKPLANIAAALEVSLLAEAPSPADFGASAPSSRFAQNSLPALLHALLVEARRMATMLDTAGVATRELRTATTQRIDGDLDACRMLLAQVTACHGIDLVWQIERLPELPFDTQVLRSLLCNLVANAIEACGGGDSIEVYAALEGADFMLQVLDTGAGMAPDTLARCTEPFFSTKPDGFGIGLALCRDLVERAGGRFEVASSVGAGTRVCLRVPLTLSPACAG